MTGRRRGSVESRVADVVARISRLLDASYPRDLDPEAILWRRVTKVVEEAGEVQGALRGYLGENPRKGQTHTLDDVITELLDCAGAALGAVSHLTGDESSVERLLARVIVAHDRLPGADPIGGPKVGGPAQWAEDQSKVQQATNRGHLWPCDLFYSGNWDIASGLPSDGIACTRPGVCPGSVA